MSPPHIATRWLRALTLLLAALGLAHTATAQTWLPPDRTTPSLWEIIGIDASGAPNWPYFREDIAGDGLDRYDTLEARLDLRSIYINRQDDNRLWLRAYVASTSQPPSSSRLHLFIDTDANSATGSQARSGAGNTWPFFETDPTEGGYERVIVISGDGALVGVWRWDSTLMMWVAEREREGAVNVEIGTDTDRLLGRNNSHGYYQFNADAAATGINATCGARFFLRGWNIDPDDPNDPARNFGDTDGGGLLACVAPDTDRDGTPDIIYQTATGCRSDADCPGSSYCYDNRVCVIGYDCARDRDCRRDEVCTSNVCVRVVPPDACTNDDQCGAFVCNDGQCRACTRTGARACEANEVCLADGRCVDAAVVGVITCANSDQCGALVCDGGQCRTCRETGPRACGSGEVCLADGRCVPDAEVDARCTTDAECGQRVCDGGRCQGCTQRGARACERGAVCRSDGRCVQDPNADPNGGTSGAGEDVLTLEPGERVQGGACTCGVVRGRADGGLGGWGWCALALGAVAVALGVGRGRGVLQSRREGGRS